MLFPHSSLVLVLCVGVKGVTSSGGSESVCLIHVEKKVVWGACMPRARVTHEHETRQSNVPQRVWAHCASSASDLTHECVWAPPSCAQDNLRKNNGRRLSVVLDAGSDRNPVVRSEQIPNPHTRCRDAAVRWVARASSANGAYYSERPDSPFVHRSQSCSKP